MKNSSSWLKESLNNNDNDDGDESPLTQLCETSVTSQCLIQYLMIWQLAALNVKCHENLLKIKDQYLLTPNLFKT